MSRRLLLLRHGQTSWNAERRIQGQAESELDETGHAQAAAVAPVLARFGPSVLWCSDSRRARQTAAYVAASTGLEARADARLREYFLGERQGLTHDEYAAMAPEEFAAFRRGDWSVVPGAETDAQVAERMSSALHELLARIPEDGLGIAVSHGAAIRDTVPALLGWPLGTGASLRGLDNCAWVALDVAEPGGPLRLQAYNRLAAV